jgi:hypothetical protein
MRELLPDYVSENLTFISQTVPNAAANIFATDVPDAKMRYIYGIMIAGAAAAPGTVSLRKLKADGVTLVDFMIGLNVVAAQTLLLPTAPDPLKPLIVLEGGTNLQSDDTLVGSPTMTLLYWDR